MVGVGFSGIGTVDRNHMIVGTEAMTMCVRIGEQTSLCTHTRTNKRRDR